MTLFEIDILAHYFCRADDWRDGDHSAPICAETFRRLCEDDLLIPCAPGKVRDDEGRSNPRYIATERCKAYIESLQAVPLPIQAWVTPGCNARTHV